MNLTKKQLTVFRFICNFYKKNNFCPSYKEIANHFNFSSVATVRTYLEHLEKKRYIQRHGKARAISITKNPFDVPILGNIQAGEPIEAIEHIESTLQNIPALQEKSSRFALNVKGDSMIDAGINENDIAIIDSQQNIKSGDIIAAKLNTDVTIKFLKKQHNSIILEPANNTYKPLLITEHHHFQILGRCVGIVRNYI